MPRARSNASPSAAVALAEEEAPKGRKTPAQGNSLGHSPPENQSPVGAAQVWTIVKLEDVADIRSGNGFPKKYQGRTEGELPFFKVGDISRHWQKGMITLTRGEHYLTRTEVKAIRAKTLPEGSVVFAKIGAAVALNRRAILGVESLVDNNVMALVPSAMTTSRFLFYFMCQVDLGASTRGGAVPSLRRGDVADLELPLPPLPEQRRIVARIEELFSRLDAGVAALRHAKAQLQRYRQSVLAAAVTGQLTQAWREQHPQGEPATEMLGDLLDRLANGTTAEQSKEPPGIPVSRIETISNATINYKRVRYVREIDREKCAQFMVRDGDILFSHINSDLHLGKTAVAIGNRELLHGMNLLLMRPCERINAKYLNYVLTHLRFSGYFMSIAQHAVNQSSLNQKKLMAIPIPVPAIAEQRQVVAEVEARTTAIDHLEAELDRQITRSNRLRQSTLAAAFSGKIF
ncbi:restriction endonuclease subunit S [Akkermansiaceae bacterium]|nr:restriction endonuclease subunit S [Akkermansiaceae bacterium]